MTIPIPGFAVDWLSVDERAKEIVEKVLETPDTDKAVELVSQHLDIACALARQDIAQALGRSVQWVPIQQRMPVAAERAMAVTVIEDGGPNLTPVSSVRFDISLHHKSGKWFVFPAGWGDCMPLEECYGGSVKVVAWLPAPAPWVG